MATEAEIRIAVQSSPTPIIPEAVDGLVQLLTPELAEVSPVLVASALASGLSGRFKHFADQTKIGPQPGSLDHHAAQFASRPTGGFERGAGKIRDLTGGLASHRPPSHSDLQGGAAPVQQPSPGSLAGSILGHLAQQQAAESQAYQVPGVGGIPSIRHAGIPRKTRGGR